MKKLTSILFAAAFLFCTVSVTFGADYANPKKIDAKQLAEWKETLTYTPATETQGATYESAVYDSTMMIVTTASYDTSNKIQSLSYKMYKMYKTYDKKNKEKFTGNFYDILEDTDDDAWVQAVYKNSVLLVRVAGSWGNYTKYVLGIYKISKKGPKLIGATLDLTDESEYISKIIFSDNKVFISFKKTNNDGTPSDNYVRVYSRGFKKYLEIPGNGNTDILTSTMSHYFNPKYWVSDDTSYSADYTETTKHVVIYKK